MTSAYEYPSLLGQDLVDAEGSSVGRVVHVWEDADGRPEWARVREGLGRGSAVVPLEGITSTGDAFRLPIPRDRLSGAPEVRGDELDDDLRTSLSGHYGLARHDDVRSEH